MHLVHPINEEHCKLFVGRAVCVVKNDGSRQIGILSGLEKGRLVLNDWPGAAGSDDEDAGKTSIKKNKAKSKNKREKAEVSASQLPPSPYRPVPFRPYGERVAVDLSSVALLFPVFL